MKPGDRVWTTMFVHSDAYDTGDGQIVEHLVDSQYHVGVDGVAIHRANPSNVIPDSPALPAVARWLADTPDAAERLRRFGIRAVAGLPVEDVLFIDSLVDALSTGRTSVDPYRAGRELERWLFGGVPEVDGRR